jgi:hypothetical protein
MKRDGRRRRGGNVGPAAGGIQARREGWKTRGESFPRFPRRGISTATLPLLPLVACEGSTRREGRGAGGGYADEARNFPQEVKS